MSASRIIRADWIAPITAPIIRDGAVAIDAGRIVAVGKVDEVIRQHADAGVDELGRCVLLPGLVNAHTHLELSNCVGGDSAPGTFVDWVIGLRPQMGSFEAATAKGIQQSLEAGVTCVGDITQSPQISRAVIADHPIRAVSFGEIIAMAKRRYRMDELLPSAMDATHASHRLRIGLSPHAPYTVELPVCRKLIQLAQSHRMPLATHLAELREEAEFLQSHTGMFRALWEMLGWWDEAVETHAGPPIRFAKDVGLLDAPTVLAHVNYCDAAELEMLAGGRASVVYCPRTHRYFGHPPHRWREMLAAGVNVAVGTDSCASSPNLDLVDDVRLLRRIAPDMPAQTLWEMATIRGARALLWDDQIGSITVNKRADFAAFAAEGDDPLEAILRNDQQAEAVWIDGQKIV